MRIIADREMPARQKEQQCSNCSKPGHNVHTCREDIEMSSKPNFS
jgi:hypothetical protein